jgi:hypothetical protein
LGLWLNPQIDMKTVSDNILEEVVKNAEYSNADISAFFYTTDEALSKKGKLYARIKESGETNLTGMRAEEDIKDKDGDDIVRVGKKIRLRLCANCATRR